MEEIEKSYRNEKEMNLKGGIRLGVGNLVTMRDASYLALGAPSKAL
jgi:hypothetical protein